MIKTFMKHKYILAIAITVAVALSAIIISFAKQSCKEGLDNGFNHCDNFCGPKAECAITREQCVKDADCSKCNNNNNVNEGFSNNTNTMNTMNTNMYDSMETSSLTTDTSTFATVIENDAQMPKMYLGPDLWTKSFNYGLGLSENKLQYDVKRRPNKYKYRPKYQVTETATGMFYDTGPIAANAGNF
jgi:hypothetical protein